MTNKLSALVILTRPYNMLSGVLIFCIAQFILASNQKITTDFFVGILAIIISFAFATLQNDLEDLEIDKINAPDKYLVTGVLNKAEVSEFKNILLWILLALSLFNFPKHLFPILIMIALVWCYNTKPLRFSYRPFLSLIVLALTYSTIPLAYSFSLNHINITPLISALIVFYFLLRFSISILKDFKDARGDKAHHKVTFYLKYGAFPTAWTSFVLGLLSYFGIVLVYINLRRPSILFILPIILIMINLFWRLKLLFTRDEKKLTRYFHRIFFGQNQIDLLFLLCLLLLKP